MKTGNILICIVVGVVINFLVGCCVCESLDDDQKSLFKWYASGPSLVSWLVPSLWPVMLYMYFTGRLLTSKRKGS